MLAAAVLKYDSITKFGLQQFLERYRDFMLTDYNNVYNYFAGKTEGVDGRSMKELRELTVQCRNACAQFKNFANRLNTCDFWELQEYVTNMNETLEKINILPKFLRTTPSKRGYTQSVEVQGTVGDLKTMDDLANSVNNANNDNTESWIRLMQNNDLNENDWEIDRMSSVNVFVNNATQVVVETVLDIPSGERVYGIDIDRKITFAENDLALKKYTKNVEQKCDILIMLNKGDVPENMNFGVNASLYSGTVRDYSYTKICSEMRDTFMQNDLFEDVTVEDAVYDGNGSIQLSVDISTKYEYDSNRKITI